MRQGGNDGECSVKHTLCLAVSPLPGVFRTELWCDEAPMLLFLSEILYFILTSYHWNEWDLGTPISDKTTNMSQNVSLYIFSSIESVAEHDDLPKT